MILVSNLEFGYPGREFRLRVPDFRVAHGETVALIGPSGTGKTTLLNLIAGIRVPQAGRVVTGEAEVSSLDDAARRDFRIRNIGLVFQEFELLEYLNVLDNILLSCRLAPGLHLDAGIRSRAAELAGRVGIGGKLHRRIDALSHGERQRVAVCRALLAAPPLLLGDEPTGNLDPANTERVLDILFRYVSENGATLLVVTHERDLLNRFDRVVDIETLAPDPAADGGPRI